MKQLLENGPENMPNDYNYLIIIILLWSIYILTLLNNF